MERQCGGCRFWHYGLCDELKCDLSPLTDACERFREVRVIEEIHSLSCGDCKLRVNGYCMSDLKEGAHRIEYVDHDEPACLRFIPRRKLWRPREIIKTDPDKLVKVVHYCGECVLFVNGYCFSCKNAPKKRNEPKLKVSPFAPACEYAIALLEVGER